MPTIFIGLLGLALVLWLAKWFARVDPIRQQASHPSNEKIDIGSKRAKTCFLAKPARRTRREQVLDA
jgi:hypothetical protein